MVLPFIPKAGQASRTGSVTKTHHCGADATDRAVDKTLQYLDVAMQQLWFSRRWQVRERSAMVPTLSSDGKRLPAMSQSILRLISVVSLAILVAACGLDVRGSRDPEDATGTRTRQSSIGGEGGLLNLNLFGGGNRSDDAAALGVNSFLWRASLDAISFMPLASADPFGGVIITDWYSAPDAQDERFKVTVYILGRQLRSDAVRAQVFRQARGNAALQALARAARPQPGQRTPVRPVAGRGPTDWVDVPVDQATSAELENTILTRARQLRIAAGGGQ